MAININHSTDNIESSSGGVNVSGLQVTSTYISPYTGFKNRIINGAMMVAKRNAGAFVATLL